MSVKYPNTLFNRVNYLHVKIHKQKMKEVGQIVKNAYLKKSGILPNKISLVITNTKGEPSTRSIAVYPDDFVNEMDQLIKAYAYANKPKRKRVFTKYLPANKPKRV